MPALLLLYVELQLSLLVMSVQLLHCYRSHAWHLHCLLCLLMPELPQHLLLIPKLLEKLWM